MDFQIVPIQKQHVDQAVQLHLRAFPNFFLTFLGPIFLKLFYKSFVANPGGVALVAVNPQDNQVVGVVNGPLNPVGYYRRLFVRRWWAFGLASIPAILKKPLTIKRIFRAAYFRGHMPPGPQRAFLSLIAVEPSFQRRGVGKALVNTWVTEVQKRGITGCYATTDAHNNEAVNRFYQDLGWHIESTWTTPEGRVMHRYVQDFGTTTRPSAE